MRTVCGPLPVVVVCGDIIGICSPPFGVAESALVDSIAIYFI